MTLVSALSVRALAVKIAAYSVLHFLIAAGVTLAFTGDMRLALAVGVIEPFVQTVAYGLYDRLWHRIDRRPSLDTVSEAAEAFTARLDVMDAAEQARAHGREEAAAPSPRRVAVKTALYAGLHFALSVGIVFGLTRDWRIALIIGVGEPIVQMVLFGLADRLWTRARAGRRTASA